MQQYIDFRNICNQRQLFRQKIKQGIFSYFEAAEYKIVKIKSENIKTKVAEYFQVLYVLCYEANELKSRTTELKSQVSAYKMRVKF